VATVAVTNLAKFQIGQTSYAVNGRVYYLYGIGPGSGQQPAPTIPAGHWAAAPLTILAGSGVLPSSGFKPDDTVIRRDALRILMGCFASGMVEPGGGATQSAVKDVAQVDPDYRIIQSAVSRGAIDPGSELDPDGTITRTAFVEWLVRALGYCQVAEMPASISLQFTDVQQLL
jgi:hypothetical protein